MNAIDLTLDAANALLDENGIEGRFTARLLREATRHHTGNRICEAIKRAKSDAGALRFVENLLLVISLKSAENRPANSATVARTADAKDARTANLPATGNDAYIPPLTFKVYGRKAALEFRAHIATKGYATVILESAGAIGERRYDWQHKITLQAMPRELPVVAAVLSGLRRKCEFKNHGPAKNKGYAIEAQDGQFFVKVFQSGDDHRMHAVPMPAEESFYVNALILRQLARAIPETDGALVTTALRAYARMAGSV